VEGACRRAGRRAALLASAPAARGQARARGRHKQGTLVTARDTKLQVTEDRRRGRQRWHSPALVSVSCAGSKLAQASEMQGGFLLHVLRWRQPDQLEALRAGAEDCWQSAYAGSNFRGFGKEKADLGGAAGTVGLGRVSAQMPSACHIHATLMLIISSKICWPPCAVALGICSQQCRKKGLRHAAAASFDPRKAAA